VLKNVFVNALQTLKFCETFKTMQNTKGFTKRFKNKIKLKSFFLSKKEVLFNAS